MGLLEVTLAILTQLALLEVIYMILDMILAINMKNGLNTIMKSMKMEAIVTMRTTAVQSLITIIVTPRVSLITISRQVEVATEDRTVYQVKALEEAAVEVLTMVEVATQAEEIQAVQVATQAVEEAEMKVEVAEAATKILSNPYVCQN